MCTAPLGTHVRGDGVDSGHVEGEYMKGNAGQKYRKQQKKEIYTEIY
jgi:hypothetical protein